MSLCGQQPLIQTYISRSIVAINCCCGLDGAGPAYQPMMQAASAQPPAVYGLNNMQVSSDNAFCAAAAAAELDLP